MIKDSFGIPYFDYMSLTCHQLWGLDPRNYKKSIYKPIDELNPDVVIMIYTIGELGNLHLSFE